MCRAHPVAFTCLTIFFSQIREVSTSFDSSIDTVCQGFCLQCIFCKYLDLTELDRVGSGSLGNYFEWIDSIVGTIIVRTINWTYRSRIQTGNYISRESCLVVEQVYIRSLRTYRTDKRSIIVCCVSQLFGSFVYFLLDSSSVFGTCSHLNIDVLDITAFLILLELFFLLVIKVFQFRFFHYDCRVYYRRIRNGSHQQVVLIHPCIESILCFYRIGKKCFRYQCLIFLSQTALNQCFLDEWPVFVHVVILFGILSRHLRFAHLGIIYQELIQHILIESTGLRVAERSLLQQRMHACLQDILNFSSRNCQSQCFCFFLNQFVINVGTPYFVAHLIGLFVVQCSHSTRELYHLGIFFYQILILLSGKSISVHLTYVMCLVRLHHLPRVTRDESKQRQTDNNHQ